MQRAAMNDLLAWKDSPTRKPLVVSGARQVGKTWLVLDFGAKHFASTAYVNLLDNEEMRVVFDGTLDPARLLTSIGIATKTNPLDGQTLVFLDEIQECPRAITALKMIQEQRPNIPVVVAGSLLGVAMNRATSKGSASWPVGKVNYLDLRPMTFLEFLGAVGEEALASLVASGDLEMAAPFSERLSSLLRAYLFVGGMPEAVLAYAANPTGLDAVREVQNRLLRDYGYDFSKHVDKAVDTERIRQTWRSVPAQLATQSDIKRFVYSKIQQGGRGRDYKDAVAWLVDAGLVHRVPRVSAPLLPLASYEDQTYFKLYLVDVGLLGAATNLDSSVILQGNALFTHFKGAFAEQYVCQQLVAAGCAPRYWTADGKAQKGEVDFMYEASGEVYPLEVKAEENVRGSSIAALVRKYDIRKGVRVSMKPFRDEGWLVNVPLWAANMLPRAF